MIGECESYVHRSHGSTESEHGKRDKTKGNESNTNLFADDLSGVFLGVFDELAFNLRRKVHHTGKNKLIPRNISLRDLLLLGEGEGVKMVMK